ncbi:MAG: hypothetical protein ACE5H9_12840 [Anaerolineae bacterium]
MRRVFEFVLLIIILGLLGVMPASAQSGGIGSSPYVAQLLVGGLNTGSLAPGEEFWYAYGRGDLAAPEAQSIILNMIFKPGGQRTVNRVSFRVFTFEQVKNFLEGTRPSTASEGQGMLVVADYDGNTGERLWAGELAAGELYYVQLVNDADLTVDYRLTAVLQDQALGPQAVPGAVAVAAQPPAAPRSAGLTLPTNVPDADRWLLAAQAIQGLPPEEAAAWLLQASSLGWLPGNAPAPAGAVEAPPAISPAEAPAAPVDPAPASQPDNSIYPGNALPLRNVNGGSLAPGSEHWYSFKKADLDEEGIESMSLTMFNTPGEGNISNRVNFELFTGRSYRLWERGTPQDMVNFGAGQLVSRDGDDRTGERLWRGTVVDGDLYYVKVKNDSNTWVDYHLITDDIVNTELGEPTVVTHPPVPSPPTGEDISAPLTAHRGRNSGHLAAGEDIWYTFEHRNLKAKDFDYRHYTMVLEHKPGYGNVANQVDLEIYPYPNYDLWARGDEDLMTPMGSGLREPYDEASGAQRRTWDGFLVANTIYFIRVRNDSDSAIDFEVDIRLR